MRAPVRTKISRRQLLAGAAGLAVAMVAGPSCAQTPTFFRIGTGGAAGTYFPIGSLIAQAAGDTPSGAPGCPAGPCGVPGLVAVAQVSNGSVANVAALQAGEIEAALVQSDIGHWAHSATGIFSGKPPHDRLRFLAHLYPEALHVVVRRGAGIRQIEDLKGKTVSLDEPGSGTLVNVRALLSAYRLSEKDFRADFIKPDLAVQRMRAGQLDAFFIVAGWPTKAVTDTAAAGLVDLLPVAGPSAQALVASNPFLSTGRIPAGTYPGIDAIDTVTVGAQLLTHAGVPEAVVHAVLSQMWSERGLSLIRAGHPRGAELALAQAGRGRSVPLHPGAARFYRERRIDIP